MLLLLPLGVSSNMAVEEHILPWCSTRIESNVLLKLDYAGATFAHCHQSPPFVHYDFGAYFI
jgi:hypothetical protein